MPGTIILDEVHERSGFLDHCIHDVMSINMDRHRNNLELLFVIMATASEGELVVMFLEEEYGLRDLPPQMHFQPIHIEARCHSGLRYFTLNQPENEHVVDTVMIFLWDFPLIWKPGKITLIFVAGAYHAEKIIKAIQYDNPPNEVDYIIFGQNAGPQAVTNVEQFGVDA